MSSSNGFQTSLAESGGRLPPHHSELVGREVEIEAILSLVRDQGARLITLTGPGGVGKTRLGVAVADRAAGLSPEIARLLQMAQNLTVISTTREPLMVRGEIAHPVHPLATPREFEVLRLIVEGKTDRQIAAELFISSGTASRHVSNILHKLDIRSRSAAAAWAIRHDVTKRQEAASQEMAPKNPCNSMNSLILCIQRTRNLENWVGNNLTGRDHVTQ